MTLQQQRKQQGQTESNRSQIKHSNPNYCRLDALLKCALINAYKKYMMLENLEINIDYKSSRHISEACCLEFQQWKDTGHFTQTKIP